LSGDRLQDALYGLRAMLRSPGITVMALLSLALGIGANTAIFTLMDAVMLRSLPVKDPGRLVILGNGTVSGITDGFGRTDLYSYPVYRQMQSQTQVFSDVAAIFSMYNDVHGFVGERSELEPMQVQLVSGNYFQMLGVPVTLAGGSLVASMLFGLKPADPLSIVAAIVLLLCVAVLAGLLPARRASRVEPMVALRCE
jgi:ABC-type antimicrobial peptide transport system permease subunit